MFSCSSSSEASWGVFWEWWWIDLEQIARGGAGDRNAHRVLTLFYSPAIMPTLFVNLRKEVKFVVDVKRRKGESFESLLRRYSRRLQQSGRAIEARKFRYFATKPTKNKQKASAIRRLEIRAKRDYLSRIGQLVDEPRTQKRR